MDSPQEASGVKQWIVRRHWLYAVSGVIWCGVGTLLCTRGWIWIAESSPEQAIAVESLSIVLGFIVYYFGFSKITKRNIDRISTLPERSSIFSFTARRGYLLIGVMMTGGYLLRNSALSKHYLSIPYTAMGGSLLLGGFRSLGTFIRQYPSLSSNIRSK
jgi:hypothetical protein